MQRRYQSVFISDSDFSRDTIYMSTGSGRRSKKIHNQVGRSTNASGSNYTAKVISLWALSWRVPKVRVDQFGSTHMRRLTQKTVTLLWCYVSVLGSIDSRTKYPKKIKTLIELVNKRTAVWTRYLKNLQNVIEQQKYGEVPEHESATHRILVTVGWHRYICNLLLKMNNFFRNVLSFACT